MLIDNVQTGVSVVLMVLAHSEIVKREIKSQVVKITDSIDGVTKALKEELTAQSNRIINIETGVNQLTSRVDLLEKKEK